MPSRTKIRRWSAVNVDILTGTAAYANVVPAFAGHTTWITKIVLSITTHAADVYLIDDDGAGSPIAAHTDAAAGAGILSVITWDFSEDGTPVTALANVDVSHSGAGIARMHLEGYYKPV